MIPAIRIEGVGVEAPDCGGMVDGVSRDGKDGALGEVVPAEGDAGARRNDAREAEGGGGVDAEGFFDDVV